MGYGSIKFSSSPVTPSYSTYCVCASQLQFVMLHSLMMIGSQILKVLLYTFLCYHCLVELLSHFVLAVTG